jgi:membrane protein implicated in regulation of membrane protease activity
MHNIDWPLAITLAVVFIVMSILRWRYFQSRARRRARRDDKASTDGHGTP